MEPKQPAHPQIVTKLVVPTRPAVASAAIAAQPDHLLHVKTNKVMPNFLPTIFGSRAAPIAATKYTLGLKPGNTNSEKEYANALDTAYGSNGDALYEHVQELSEPEQQAVYQHSELLRAFLGIAPKEGMQQIASVEAPAALALAATLMRKPDDAMIALGLMKEELAALPPTPIPQQQALRNSAEVAMSRLAAEPDRLANDKVRQMAMSIIESHIDKLDQPAQKVVKKSAVAALGRRINATQRKMTKSFIDRDYKWHASDSSSSNTANSRLLNNIGRTNQPPRSVNTEPVLSPQDTLRALKARSDNTEVIGYFHAVIADYCDQISCHVGDDNECRKILTKLNEHIHKELGLRVRFTVNDVYDLSEHLSEELSNVVPTVSASQALPTDTADRLVKAITKMGDEQVKFFARRTHECLFEYNRAADGPAEDAAIKEFNTDIAQLGMTLTAHELEEVSLRLGVILSGPVLGAPTSPAQQYLKKLGEHLQELSRINPRLPPVRRFVNAYWNAYQAAPNAAEKNVVMTQLNSDVEDLGRTLAVKDLQELFHCLREMGGTANEFLEVLNSRRADNLPDISHWRDISKTYMDSYRQADNNAGKVAAINVFNDAIAPFEMTLTHEEVARLNEKLLVSPDSEVDDEVLLRSRVRPSETNRAAPTRPVGTERQYLEALDVYLQTLRQSNPNVPHVRQFINSAWTEYQQADDTAKNTVLQNVNIQVKSLGLELSAIDLKQLFECLSKERPSDLPIPRAVTAKEFVDKLVRALDDDPTSINIEEFRTFVHANLTACNDAADDAGKEAVMKRFNQRLAETGMSLTMEELPALLMAVMAINRPAAI